MYTMCCMVCLMPQSQVSCSLENPHFNMFTLGRPACVRNRLSAFHGVQGFSAPAGRCSSAHMLRCTLASRGSSRSLHSSKRAAFAVVMMGLVHVIKLFRDLRCGTTPRCQLSGCISSVACRVRSVQLATALLMSNRTIPASTGRLLAFAGLIHPVIILKVSCNVVSSFFVWVECSPTGQEDYLYPPQFVKHVLIIYSLISSNKNKIRWWSHVKRMAPTAPESRALVIHPVGKRPRGRPRNRWEDDVPKGYEEMGIPMTDVNNWVKERRPIMGHSC